MENKLRNSKRDQLVFLILIFLFGAFHLYIAFSPRSSMMNWYLIDDAFYYFQVARHVVAGHGVTFDGINLSNGFHPLWMIVNLPIFAVAGQADFLPLRIIILVSALLTLSSGILLYQLLKIYLSSLTALLTFTVWLFYWPIHSVVTQSGMESALNAFFLLLMIFLAVRLDFTKSLHILGFGLAGALTLLARLDNIFFVMLMGAWIVFRQHPMRFLVLADIVSCFLSVFIALVLRLGTQESLFYLSPAYILLVIGLFFRLLFYYIFGLYRTPRDFELKKYVILFLTGFAASSLLILGFMLLGMVWGWFGTLPRSVLIYELLIFALLSGLSRWLVWLFQPESDSDAVNFNDPWQAWLSKAALYLLPLTFLFGGYLIWNFETFGTPLPVSGQIKQWWGTLPNPVYGKHQQNLLTILGLNPEFTRIDPWGLVKDLLFTPILSWFGNTSLPVKMLVSTVLVISYGALAYFLYRTQTALVKRTLVKFSLPPIIAASLLHPFFLSVTGYLHARPWYWVLQIILMLLIFALLIEAALRALNRNAALQKWTPFLIYGAIVMGVLASGVKFYYSFPPQDRPEYLDQFTGISRFLEKNTETGAIIGMTGGGMESFFIQDRTIVNMDGLINSYTYFQMMKLGQAELYLDEIGLDYVMGSPDMLLDSDPYWWFFTGRLQPLSELEGKGSLYRYHIPGKGINP